MKPGEPVVHAHRWFAGASCQAGRSAAKVVRLDGKQIRSALIRSALIKERAV